MSLVGKIVSFGYEGQTRTVLVASVWVSLAGKELITGLDELRNDTRTFRVDRIEKGAPLVPAQDGRQDQRPAR